MRTQVQKINPEDFQDQELQTACTVLQEGGLVAFPTETVYGLGADALRPEASRRIYEAKGRPSDNPLIIHIADMDALYDVAEGISHQAIQLAEAFWPGPLTMIFQKKEKVPFSTTGGLDTVAVRMPGHPVALALLRRSGVYIAAPSANLSGRPSPTKAEHVREDLEGRVDLILDGGDVGIGLESTILDLSVERPVILRPGYVTRNMLEEVIGQVQLDPAVSPDTMRQDIVAKAPGMKYRHYAPRGEMTIVEGEIGQVVAAINRMAEEKRALGIRVAVIATEETKELYQCELIRSIGSRKTEGSIAAGLYDILREMDHLKAEFIFAESFETDRLGKAIMNRMLKAASHHLIRV